jgi:Flp pilus assembly protein TadG
LASQPEVRRIGQLRRGWVRGQQDDRGSTVVESVLIVPLAMLVLLLIVQFALWAHAAQAAHTAASEADRVAVAQGGGTAAAINQAQLVLHAAGSDLQSSKIVVTLLPGDQEQVSVSGQATSILPEFKLPVSSVEVGPVQEFRSAE